MESFKTRQLTDALKLLISKSTCGLRKYPWKSCEEVVKSIWANETNMHGPIQAYVVNFATTHPSPYKFLSVVCTKEIEKGRTCWKSLDCGEQCDHDSLAKGTFTDVYRFEVILIDANHNGDTTPMWCTISEAASKLLDVPVTVFREWTEDEQTDYVRNIILQTPICEFYLGVKDGEVTAHIFYIFDPVPERTLPLRVIPTAGPSLSRSISCIPSMRPDAVKDKGKQKVVEESHESSDEGPDGRLVGASEIAALGVEDSSSSLATTSSSNIFFSEFLDKPIYKGSCSTCSDNLT